MESWYVQNLLWKFLLYNKLLVYYNFFYYIQKLFLKKQENVFITWKSIVKNL